MWCCRWLKYDPVELSTVVPLGNRGVTSCCRNAANSCSVMLRMVVPFELLMVSPKNISVLRQREVSAVSTASSPPAQLHGRDMSSSKPKPTLLVLVLVLVVKHTPTTTTSASASEERLAILGQCKIRNAASIFLHFGPAFSLLQSNKTKNNKTNNERKKEVGRC